MMTMSKALSAPQARTYHAREFASEQANYWSRGQQGHSEWQGKLAAEWGSRGGWRGAFRPADRRRAPGHPGADGVAPAVADLREPVRQRGHLRRPPGRLGRHDLRAEVRLADGAGGWR